MAKKGTVKEVSEKELHDRLAKSGDERRTDERVEAKLEIEVPLANWDQVRSVYTTNISKGGLLFSVSAPASMAAAVDLTVTLPNGERVTLQSEVRHVARRGDSAEYDVGVQFAELDARVRAVFEQALAALKS
jgi:c-di-GMP-binding flagellar brake protein YcgR